MTSTTDRADVRLAVGVGHSAGSGDHLEPQDAGKHLEVLCDLSFALSLAQASARGAPRSGPTGDGLHPRGLWLPLAVTSTASQTTMGGGEEDWGRLVELTVAGDRRAYGMLVRLVTGHLAHWRA